MAKLAVFLLSMLVGAWSTAIIRRRAMSGGVLDVPNERSSHEVPTPRGGGLAVAAISLATAAVLGLTKSLNLQTVVALCLGGIAIAAIGFIDDRRGLAALPRLFVQLAAAAVTVMVLSFPHAGIELPFKPMPALIVQALLVLGIVWSVNLFNFMDGIDGLAASQAIFVSAAAAGFVLAGGLAGGWVILLAATAGAASGFLVWNWPPARIFMGDVGSAFLGFWLAALGIALELNSVLSLWVFVALATLFIADATCTLVRRVISGERWYAAHRSHLYQRLSRRFGHRRVTLLASLINLVVILPITVVVWRQPQSGPWIASATLCVTSIAFWLLGAGRDETLVRG